MGLWFVSTVGEEEVKVRLCSESVLRIRREDVLKRLTPDSPLSLISDLQTDPSWKNLKVEGTIKMLLVHVHFSPHVFAHPFHVTISSLIWSNCSGIIHYLVWWCPTAKDSESGCMVYCSFVMTPIFCRSMQYANMPPALEVPNPWPGGTMLYTFSCVFWVSSLCIIPPKLIM